MGAKIKEAARYSSSVGCFGLIATQVVLWLPGLVAAEVWVWPIVGKTTPTNVSQFA